MAQGSISVTLTANQARSMIVALSYKIVACGCHVECNRCLQDAELSRMLFNALEEVK